MRAEDGSAFSGRPENALLPQFCSAKLRRLKNPPAVPLVSSAKTRAACFMASKLTALGKLSHLFEFLNGLYSRRGLPFNILKPLFYGCVFKAFIIPL
jgi:hypothetical protein